MVRIRPDNRAAMFEFFPGQFCQIRNPDYHKLTEAHSFSIASPPETKEYLEICFKVYGDWTKACSQKSIGDTLLVAGPYGRFVWDDDASDAVFLAGGVGIAPFMAMLRHLVVKSSNTTVTVIYGSRTPDTIVYRKQVEQLCARLPNSSVVHILSEVSDDDPWSGYRGFVTCKLLRQEIDFARRPTFFLCGPQIFVAKMRTLLAEMHVDDRRVRFELFTRPGGGV